MDHCDTKKYSFFFHRILLKHCIVIIHNNYPIKKNNFIVKHLNEEFITSQGYSIKNELII